MNVASPFISDCEATEAIEPGKASFDHPTMPAEFFSALNAPACDARRNPACATVIAAARIVVALVGMTFVGTPAWAARFSGNRRNGTKHFPEHGTIVDIGAGQAHGERNAAPVGHQMPFRARLAAIRWIWARGIAPFLAGMDEESTQTRLKSMRLAWRRRRNNSRCNASHTPAFCQSRRRRQHVTPEPQPNSGGRSSHAMPLRSTNSIPLSAARSEMRGRPPLGFATGAGRSFSTMDQRSSGIRTEGIPSYESLFPRRTRVLKGILSSLHNQVVRFAIKRIIAPKSSARANNQLTPILRAMASCVSERPYRTLPWIIQN